MIDFSKYDFTADDYVAHLLRLYKDTGCIFYTTGTGNLEISDVVNQDFYD